MSQYPPQYPQQPYYQQPPPGYPPQGYYPPPYPPRRQGMSGCLIATLVGVGLVAVLVIVGAIGAVASRTATRPQQATAPQAPPVKPAAPKVVPRTQPPPSVTTPVPRPAPPSVARPAPPTPTPAAAPKPAVAIPGLTPQAVIDALPGDGYKVSGPKKVDPSDASMFWYAEQKDPSRLTDVPAQFKGVEFYSDDARTVRRVNAFTAVTKLKTVDPNEYARDFFGELVEALAYQGADPAKARAWVEGNIGKNAKTKFGAINFEIEAINEARHLRIWVE